jgi:hypothetical protein
MTVARVETVDPQGFVGTISAGGDSIKRAALSLQQPSRGLRGRRRSMEGGGHQVYGHTNFLPPFLGAGTSQVSAPDIIMAGFARR